MNEKINDLVNARLNKIFADYPNNKDLQELKAELASDLEASAEDKFKEDVSETAAVNQAFNEFGDIDEVINSVLHEDNDNDSKPYHHTFHAHNLDVDEDGIRVDNGKLVNINDDGININHGTIKIDDDGIKLGNMIINDDGINFGGQTKHHAADNFDAQFNSSNFDTEVHVESLPLTDEFEFEMNDLNQIDVYYESASVKVLPTDGSKIRVREYMSRTNPEYQVKTDIVGNVLKIQQGKIPHFLPLRVKVQILVPEKFLGNLRISNHSGNLQLKDLHQFANVLVDVHSGMLYAEDVEVNKFLANASSGKITLEDVNANDELSIKTKSSSVNLDEVFSSNYNISANSGTIKALDLGGAGVISAKSGTIKIGFAKITDDVQIENNSGTVKVEMPDDSYTFDLEANSGTVKMGHAANYKHDILNLKEGTVGNDPQYNLKIRAKSGTIKVN